jgi:hypothetical protein
MNVSLENRVVWFAPERTGSSITKKIFENYNFFSATKKKDYKLIDFRKNAHSHENKLSEEYSDFNIITNIRNPYDRVFACYQKFYIEKPILKNNKDFKKKFSTWVSENFWSIGFHVFLSSRHDDAENYFQKWTFEKQNVDFYIKMENLKEDILKLPFISKDDEEIQRIEGLLRDNSFINERYHSFQDAFDVKSAKLVYEFFKPCFYKFDYDPFSFTRESLTDQDKISFIHNTFD